MKHLTTFLEHFRPTGSTTYVGIVPDGSTVAASFNGSDSSEATHWIRAQNKARNIYFTVNPTAPGQRKKPKKEDITEITAVWADIDPLDGNGRPWADERERLEALADELHALPTPPTFIVDSGNGVQPVWMLDCPIEATPEFQAAAESLCTRIESALGAKGTFNCDRVLRVPGTINFPNKKKRDLGRGETRARLARWTWRRHSWTDLLQLADRLEQHPPRHAVPITSSARASHGAADEQLDAIPPVTKELRARFEAALAKDAKLRARWGGAPPDGPDQSRSAWDLSLARLLRRHGFTVEEYAALAAKWDHGKGTDGDARHFARCWEKAAPSEFDLAVARLAALPPHEYDKKRKAEAKRLEVRVGTLDLSVLKARGVERRSNGRTTGLGKENQQDNFDQPLGSRERSRSNDLSRKNVLKWVADTAEQLGAAGVRREVKVLYLAMTTRLLPSPTIPAHVIVKGPSAGGKNYLLNTVARLFPPSAYYKMTGMSDRALAYLDEPVAHRFILLAEASAIPEDAIAWVLIRSLLSEGEIRYPTVEKDEHGRLVSNMRHLEGPTGLIMTTTLPRIHAENETRHLTINISDEWSQTKAVLGEQAALARGKEVAHVDLTAWHDYQRWLAEQDCRVVVPFADQIVALMQAAPVRVRRDFPRFLALIMAHTLLHLANRDRDPEGHLIATLDDYEAVHRLTGRAFAEGAELRHPASVVQLVEAVAELPGGERGERDGKSDESSGVTIHQLIEHAKDHDWGTTNRDVLTRRCREAIARGLLVNLETKRGQLARYQVSGELGEDAGLFPSPRDLEEALRSTVRPTVRPPHRSKVNT